MEDIHENSFRASLSGIFKSGRYSDMTIVCDARELPVHQAVICPRSKFFAAACDGSFQESITKRIELEDDDLGTVERMLSYLYTCDYDDGSSELEEAAPISSEEEADGEDGSSTVEASHAAPLTGPTESISAEYPEEESTDRAPEGELNVEESPLLNNVLVYAIADKYDISKLKERAKEKFENHVDTLLSSPEFPEVVKTIYKSTPSKDRCLRDIVSRACVKQVRELMEVQAFKGIISDVGDFGIDILREALKRDDERLAQVMDQKVKLEGKARETKAEMRNLKSEISQGTNTLKRVIRLVNETESCWHCNVEFYGRIEETRTVLQCVKCQVRQRVF